MAYRQLTANEIKLLEMQHCYCEDWQKVLVTEKFVSDKIRDVHFSGTVKLGNLSGTIEVADGVEKTCGIDHSYIHNCTISDKVRISHVNNLSNYVIENDVVIENVTELSVTGETTFGNGTELDILNEGGGRTLKIYDQLTAQIAYLQVTYRHDRELQNRLNELIDVYVAAKKASVGIVKQGARLVDCNILKNLTIGGYVTLDGAFSLEDGTIIGCQADSTYIGVGVVAKHFIVLQGSRVENGVILEKCFVGQGVRLGKQFSAENSAFFANCEGFHGEAVSLFAGPYTVTHHKSTLLIAAMTSFFNAGSGTNQSNHMYKIGPVHQGVLERGAKTGSFSYMLWPARVGIFSVVIGKHYSNFDTSDLPFSYIFESDGKSILYPGKNLFTGGTRRDTAKWASRDRRKTPDKYDLINFDFRGPYVINKLLKGIEVLRKIDAAAPADQPYASYQGVMLKRNQIRDYINNYEMSIKVCLGFAVVNRLEALLTQNKTPNLDSILIDTSPDMDNWLDLAGMYAPQKHLTNILEAVKHKKIKSPAALRKELTKVHDDYPNLAWSYVLELIKIRFATEQVTLQHLVQIVKDWKDETVKLNKLILKDIYKEFDQNSRISYGIDGDQAVRDADFYAVRGSYEENKVVLDLEKESAEIITRADKLIKYLQQQ